MPLPAGRRGLRAGVLFVVMAFLSSGRSRTDDADSVRSLREADEQQPAGPRVADDDLTGLGIGVILVGEDPCERVGEDRSSFVERDSVLREIGSVLPRVPAE